MFLDVEKANSLAADDLVKAAKIVFTKFGLPKSIISDAGMNFTSDTFKQFCRRGNIQKGTAFSYHNHSSGQVEACIMFVKCTIKKCLDNNNDVNLALLQIRSMLIGAWYSVLPHCYLID